MQGFGVRDFVGVCLSSGVKCKLEGWEVCLVFWLVSLLPDFGLIGSS